MNTPLRMMVVVILACHMATHASEKEPLLKPLEPCTCHARSHYVKNKQSNDALSANTRTIGSIQGKPGELRYPTGMQIVMHLLGTVLR